MLNIRVQLDLQKKLLRGLGETEIENAIKEINTESLNAIKGIESKTSVLLDKKIKALSIDIQNEYSEISDMISKIDSSESNKEQKELLDQILEKTSTISKENSEMSNELDEIDIKLDENKDLLFNNEESAVIITQLLKVIKNQCDSYPKKILQGVVSVLKNKDKC